MRRFIFKPILNLFDCALVGLLASIWTESLVRDNMRWELAAVASLIVFLVCFYVSTYMERKSWIVGRK